MARFFLQVVMMLALVAGPAAAMAAPPPCAGHAAGAAGHHPDGKVPAKALCDACAGACHAGAVAPPATEVEAISPPKAALNTPPRNAHLAADRLVFRLERPPKAADAS